MNMMKMKIIVIKKSYKKKEGFLMPIKIFWKKMNIIGLRKQ